MTGGSKRLAWELFRGWADAQEGQKGHSRVVNAGIDGYIARMRAQVQQVWGPEGES